MFEKLCGDDTPMVRRAAAAHLGPLARQLMHAPAVEGEGTGGSSSGISIVTGRLLPLASRLAKDQQDSVRLLAVDVCASLAPLVGPEAAAGQLLPMAVQLCNDSSWRVRWSVANGFASLCSALGADAAKGELLHAFGKLAADAEAEVRTAAAS